MKKYLFALLIAMPMAACAMEKDDGKQEMEDEGVYARPADNGKKRKCDYADRDTEDIENALNIWYRVGEIIKRRKADGPSFLQPNELELFESCIGIAAYFMETGRKHITSEKSAKISDSMIWTPVADAADFDFFLAADAADFDFPDEESDTEGRGVQIEA